MRKPVTDIEVTYEQVEVSPEENQQRLNEMFDVLFEETIKYLKAKQKFEKEKMKGGEIKNAKNKYSRQNCAEGWKTFS